MGGSVAGARQLVLGHLILFSLLGMSVVGGALLNERRWHTFDRLRATPARTVELLAGKALPILLFLLVQQAVVLGLGVAVLDLRVASFPLLVLADLVWAVTVLCLGTAVAVLVRSFAQLSAVIDIGASIVVGLGGGLVPLTALPHWAQTIAPVWPAYWAMRSLTAAVTGDTAATMTGCAVLGGIAALAAAVAGVRLARGWGRETLL
jgi:ABC-2 type transport system permease protein